jgi:Ca-activated chloride channel family protein
MKLRTLVKKQAMIIGLSSCLASGAAFAGASVSWTSPANGSSYLVGTVVNPTGTASGVGGQPGTGLDLALVLDSSGSMFGGGQLAQQNAALALVAALPGATSSVAVIDFDSFATVKLGLTPVSTGLATINSAITSIDASGGTDIGAGINAATSVLTGAGHTPGRTQVMVVVSDGSTAGNPGTAADAAVLAGVDSVHAVGIPGHVASQMQNITNGPDNILGTADDIGVYTAGSLDALTALFNGTAGNLVGLSRVDVTLPNGTILSGVPTDGLGNFALSGWTMLAGANTFTATAFATDGSQATATLTLFGTTPGGGGNRVPDGGATAALLGFALCSVSFLKKKRK